MDNSSQQTISSFLDSDSLGFQQCIIHDNIATADGFNIYLFGKQKMSNHPTFSITFLKMLHGVGVGIVDSKLKASSYIANEPNVVTYRNDRTCRTGTETKEKMGKGYRTYETVDVTMDMENKRVVWSVGGQTRHSVQYNLIQDEEIQWVPYIRLCDKGDKVQINFK